MPHRTISREEKILTTFCVEFYPPFTCDDLSAMAGMGAKLNHGWSMNGHGKKIDVTRFTGEHVRDVGNPHPVDWWGDTYDVDEWRKALLRATPEEK